ncbi:hypothetical protein FGO68_gene17596 [Halteria grandinella]|uniref:Uncharacterized protein n=1 Tax=Halteria grandinella TaxID=5974 RepID=A0A8J8NC21_HALGN|nr:hypothetical protein FGO68_gene17596 [Halteria grandinella]
MEGEMLKEISDKNAEVQRHEKALEGLYELDDQLNENIEKLEDELRLLANELRQCQAKKSDNQAMREQAVAKESERELIQKEIESKLKSIASIDGQLQSLVQEVSQVKVTAEKGRNIQ